MIPHPAATGDAFAVQRRIAWQFSRQDPLPEKRRAHFQWCDRYPLVRGGWSGTIEGTSPSPGGWLVRVKVRPTIISRNVRMSDYFLETYEFSREGLRFIDGTGPRTDEDGGLVFL